MYPFIFKGIPLFFLFFFCLQCTKHWCRTKPEFKLALLEIFSKSRWNLFCLKPLQCRAFLLFWWEVSSPFVHKKPLCLSALEHCHGAFLSPCSWTWFLTSRRGEVFICFILFFFPREENVLQWIALLLGNCAVERVMIWGSQAKKKNLNNVIFHAASGIAPTHRRTSRTTRTGSKRRSTCCFAVRPSRQQSEASEGMEGRAGQDYFSYL